MRVVKIISREVYVIFIFILVLACFFINNFTSYILLSLLPPIPTPNQNAGHSNSNGNSIAAFYTCHNQIAATDKVLRYFRAHQPDSKIYLFNDAGSPFIRYLANKYHATYVHHSVHAVTTSFGNYWNSSERAWVYVRDLLNTAVASKSDWVILLEDDTLVMNSISTDDLRFDMNGVNPNRYQYGNEDFFWYRVVQKYIRQVNASYDTHWGYNGCGGTIFRGSFLRQMARNATLIRQQLDAFAKMALEDEGLKFMPSDQVLSFLIQINGGSMGTNEHYLEPWWGHAILNYLSGSAQILHGDKTSYTKVKKTNI
jgi:hypothetical protein